MRRSKYGVRQDAQGRADRTHNGILFGSKLEKRRFQELLLLQQAGHIAKLQRQVSYPLMAFDTHSKEAELAGRYIADFVYYDMKDKRTVVEDVKSPATRTPLYNFKRKMMLLCYGIDIYEWPERPHGRRSRK